MVEPHFGDVLHPFREVEMSLIVQGASEVGRDDFQFFWNFITAIQILPCVIETRRYGYIRDSGGRVETPH